MKLMTWNINGIRSIKQPIKIILDSLMCDIICFQETKITRDMLGSDIAIVDGYSSYFSFSQVKQGYSGVSTYCRKDMTPVKAQEGLFHFNESEAGEGKIGFYGNMYYMFTEERMRELDKEGRTMITQHKYRCKDGQSGLLTIINVYCPRADPEKPERKEFKLDFYRALAERTKAILQSGSSVIVCGDVNTSHRRIDHCDPDDPEMFYDNACREWMDQILYGKGDYSTLKENFNRNLPTETGLMVDSFRYFFPDRKNAFTCWCTLKGCRQTNYGTRIDYILPDTEFHLNYMEKCDICPEIEGSDHCPVMCEMKCEVMPSKKCPPCCTKYMPEFGGRQQRLLNYFTQKPASDDVIVKPMTSISASTNFESAHHFSGMRKRKLKSIEHSKSGNKQTKLSHFIVKQKVQSVDTEVERKNNPIINLSPVHVQKLQQNSAFWKSVLKGPDPPPLCKGHNEPCVMRTVKKEGPNFGKKFYVCDRPDGHKNNSEARCSFFEWKKS